jgi:hypothetical protein
VTAGSAGTLPRAEDDHGDREEDLGEEDGCAPGGRDEEGGDEEVNAPRPVPTSDPEDLRALDPRLRLEIV